MNNFKSLTDEELTMIDGGGENDRGFGSKVGRALRDGVDYVGDSIVEGITYFFPGEPVY